uniref:Uncharacterized protein n=1 Tax=Lepeophtheirus salmonis TaxID=72036 RepID=A0A0K2UG16_LEPSM
MKLLVIFACLVVLASSAKIDPIDVTLPVMNDGQHSCAEECQPNEFCLFGACSSFGDFNGCDAAEQDKCSGELCVKVERTACINPTR